MKGISYESRARSDDVRVWRGSMEGLLSLNGLEDTAVGTLGI